MEIEKKLKDARVQAGLTQEQIAESYGIKTNYIELGKWKILARYC